jgi:hypothetical protein
MEQYSDLVANGLDLVSFIVLTPEILRVIAPTASRLLGSSTAMVACFAAALVFFLVPLHLLLSAWLGLEVPNRARSGLLMGGAGGLWQLRGSSLADRLGRYASKHFLAFGITLFFVSRLIAFYSSAMKGALL